MALDDIITLIIRTIFSYIFLLIILKVMGKRELSQVSIFDVVIFLIMSELFSLALNDPDASILHFIIPVIVIAILELISSLVSLKFIKIRKFLEGKISFIIYKGEIDFKTMKKNRYNIPDLMLQLRNKDIQSPIEVEYAILEGNGKINYDALKKLNLDETFIYSLLAKNGYTSPQQIFFGQLLTNGFFIVPFEK